MRKILFSLTLLFSFVLSFGQLTPVQKVSTIIQLKAYNGSAAFVYVADTRKLYSTCTPCTANETTIYAGVGGKKWEENAAGGSFDTTGVFINYQNAINARAKYTDTSGMLAAYQSGLNNRQLYDADLTSWAAIAPSAKQDADADLTTLAGNPATTIGLNFLDLGNPGAIRFFRSDASNNVIAEDAATFRTSIGAGTGTVTAASVATANGFQGSSGGGTTPVLTLQTSVSGMLKGSSNALTQAVSGTDYSAGTSALATGILKSTTSTGALSIAVAADFPTLNQNTSGSAGSLTNTRTIWGQNFNGTANVSGSLTGVTTIAASSTISAVTGSSATIADSAMARNPSTGIFEMRKLPAAGSGDLVGAASSTDNAITRFDGITGKLVQNSTATLTDGGEIRPTAIQVGATATLDARTKSYFYDGSTATSSFALSEWKANGDNADFNFEGGAVVKHSKSYNLTPGYAGTFQVYGLAGAWGTIVGNNSFTGNTLPYAPTIYSQPNSYFRVELGPIWPQSEKFRINNSGDFIFGTTTLRSYLASQSGTSTVNDPVNFFDAADASPGRFFAWGDETGGTAAYMDKITAFTDVNNITTERVRTIATQRGRVVEARAMIDTVGNAYFKVANINELRTSQYGSSYYKLTQDAGSLAWTRIGSSTPDTLYNLTGFSRITTGRDIFIEGSHTSGFTMKTFGSNRYNVTASSVQVQQSISGNISFITAVNGATVQTIKGGGIWQHQPVTIGSSGTPAPVGNFDVYNPTGQYTAYMDATGARTSATRVLVLDNAASNSADNIGLQAKASGSASANKGILIPSSQASGVNDRAISNESSAPIFSVGSIITEGVVRAINSPASATTADSAAYINRTTGNLEMRVLPAGGGGGGFSNPMTTLGDIITGGASGTPTRLAGSAGFLKSTGAAAPTWSAIAESDVTNLTTDLGNKQASDADLTTIAGLTATTDNFIVGVASAWASRTPAQVKTTLAINNVENTALSTWAGSTNITTLGTIGSALTVSGAITGGGTFIAGGAIQTTSTNSAATFTAANQFITVSGTPELLYGGATQVKNRAWFRGSTNVALAANDSYANVVDGLTVATGASSGTHAAGATHVFRGFTFTPNATTPAAMTNAASVWVNEAPTGATNNWAIYVAAGNSKLNGDLEVTGTFTNSGLTSALAGKQAADADLTTWAGLTPTTAGQNLVTVTNPSAISFPRFAADNTVTTRTPSQVLSDIGAQAADADLTTWAGITPTTVGQNLVTAANPSAIRYVKINADNSVSLRTQAEMQTDLGIGSGGGSVNSVSIVSANGFAGTSNGNATAPALTISTSITGILKGDGTAISAAVAGDFPTLNQNTTGSAATLTTTRTIFGQNFNGSANVTGDVSTTGVTLTIQSSNPSTPSAGTTKNYSYANGTYKPELRTINEEGVWQEYQARLASGRFDWWYPAVAATTSAFSASGNAAATMGTATTRAITSPTNAFTQSTRVGFVTAATASSLAGLRAGTLQYTRGSATGMGGYEIVFTVGFSAASTPAQRKAFVGLYTTATSNPAGGTNPTSFINSIGFSCDIAVSNNWNIMSNDGTGTATTTTLGANFPANTNNTDYYEFRLYCKPNDTKVLWYAKNIHTGNETSGSVTTDLPVNTDTEGWMAYVTNGTTASADAIDVAKIYAFKPYN